MSFFDPKHPLYQKAVVFTGELSIDRREAMQRAVNVGAVIKTAVSRKPIFLWWDGNTTDQEEPPPSATRRKRPRPFLLRGSPTSAFSRKQNFSSFTGLSAPYFACRTPRRRNKTLIKNAVDLCTVVHGVLFNV